MFDDIIVLIEQKIRAEAAKEGVGVTVEKPPRHCPVPVWEQKEAEGVAVLQEFLTPQQWRDFEKYKSFLCRGNHTGNLYLLVSRWNPACEILGVLRSVTKDRSICAALRNVPPSEELLAMKISVECDERDFLFLN